MCGIIGIVGTRPHAKAAIELLRRLESRGYDAAGIATRGDGGIKVLKKLGKVDVLAKAHKRDPIDGHVVTAHTRWATHGNRLEERNAHPHTSKNGTVAVVHNGTISNFTELKKSLAEKGYVPVSQTDSELLAHVIEDELRKLESEKIPHFMLERAVANAVKHLEGDDCAFLVTCSKFKNELVAYRRNRPLCFGMKKGQIYVASDAMALAGKVDRVFGLERGTIATLSSISGVHIKGHNDADIDRLMKPIGISSEEMVLTGYPHWMLMEIHQQVKSILAATEGRFAVSDDGLSVTMEILDLNKELWSKAERIFIVACGTSMHAALLAKLFIESRAHVPVEVVIGSEYKSSQHLINKHTPVIGLSQSGNTADVVDSLEAARKLGAPIFGITNAPTSQLFLMVTSGVLLKAGHETAVASTKTFTSQLAVLALFSVGLAIIRDKGDVGRDRQLLRGLQSMGSTIKEVLKQDEQIKEIAERFAKSKRFIMMGRGYGYPVALEGALKMKEIAYVDAHGHPGGEFKHGPLALVENGTPVIGIIFDDGRADSMLLSLNQAKTSGGSIIIFDTTGREDVAELADFLVRLPKVVEPLSAIVGSVAFQLLSYWSGIYRGVDIDTPRNLAKSVTVG